MSISVTSASFTRPNYSEENQSVSVNDNEVSDNNAYVGIADATPKDILNSYAERKPLPDPKYIHNEPVRGWYYPSGSFVYYAQEYSYSCGAACVRMALKTLTGTTYSEATVRTGCNTTSYSGTTIANMKSYINSQQSHNTYISEYSTTLSNFKYHLYIGIQSYDAPPIVSVSESPSYSWPFTLSAHGVLISGIKDNKERVMIADPWVGYIGSSYNPVYYFESSNLYASYLSSKGYMY